MWFKKFRRNINCIQIDQAAIGVGSNTITIKAHLEDMQIAYKIWVELSTRKIGLEIDLDHDVIEEVYNSWYEFFTVTRELIKNIPVSKVRGVESTKELVDLSISILNEGIRPHLTRWQARFRRWYKSEMDRDEKCLISPQDCQKKFPQYKELCEDILIVNKRLIAYRIYMRKMALE